MMMKLLQLKCEFKNKLTHEADFVLVVLYCHKFFLIVTFNSKQWVFLLYRRNCKSAYVSGKQHLFRTIR